MTRIMAQSTDSNDSFQEKVLAELKALKEQIERSNEKFENYQKATQWIVQLAFSLIAAATVTVIFSTILNQ